MPGNDAQAFPELVFGRRVACMENRCLFGNAKTINKPHCKRRKEVCFIYKNT